MTRGGIDCTKPAEEAFSELNRTDDDIFARIKLEEFIPEKKLETIPTERM